MGVTAPERHLTCCPKHQPPLYPRQLQLSSLHWVMFHLLPLPGPWWQFQTLWDQPTLPLQLLYRRSPGQQGGVSWLRSPEMRRGCAGQSRERGYRATCALVRGLGSPLDVQQNVAMGPGWGRDSGATLPGLLREAPALLPELGADLAAPDAPRDARRTLCRFHDCRTDVSSGAALQPHSQPGAPELPAAAGLLWAGRGAGVPGCRGARDVPGRQVPLILGHCSSKCDPWDYWQPRHRNAMGLPILGYPKLRGAGTAPTSHHTAPALHPPLLLPRRLSRGLGF